MAVSMANTECNNEATSAPRHSPPWEFHLQVYLILLSTLVATATYAVGLSPPGGVWQDNKDGPDGHTAGVPILYHSPRYLAFFYFNATAFAASLVVSLIVLVVTYKHTLWIAVLRLVMVIGLLSFLGAFAAGSCEDLPTTMYVSTLVVALVAYVGIHTLVASYAPQSQREYPDESLEYRRRRRLLLTLAMFAASISYTAGLSPPGGFRAKTQGSHGAGEPMLKAHHSPRLKAFFYCNTTALVASLFIIVLLLGRRIQRFYARLQLYGFILVALLGLLGAYAAGSSRDPDKTGHVLALVVAVPSYIFVVMVVAMLVTDPLKKSSSWLRLKSISARASCWLRERGCRYNQTDRDGEHSRSPASELLAVATLGSVRQGRECYADHQVNTSNKKDGIDDKVKHFILLFASLAATITYQAGMDPPGGVWPAHRDEHHKAGDPILLLTHPKRYKVFFYCNSTAFVASLVVILMVQHRSLIRGCALEVAMIVDLFGLIGAYTAGSCREASTSIYVIVLAGAVLFYVVIHVVFFTPDNEELTDEVKKKIDKTRNRMLIVSILVFSVTYQPGLTPPGGFWSDDGDGRPAGSPILEGNGVYRTRYLAFLCCNSMSFVASMAHIIMLVKPNLYRRGIRCYALHVCVVVSVFGLTGASAAGSSREGPKSIYLVVAIVVVVAFMFVHLLVLFRCCAISDFEYESYSPRPRRRVSRKAEADADTKKRGKRRNDLMLLAILGATLTYQAGLKPPGSTWEESLPGLHTEGDPVMYDTNRVRYQAFFYCNSASFVASLVVIVLLLPESLQDHGLLLYAMNTAMVLDLLGLVGAYAAGSSREWHTSGYVIALATIVLAYITIRGGTSAEEEAEPRRVKQYPCSSSAERNEEMFVIAVLT